MTRKKAFCLYLLCCLWTGLMLLRVYYENGKTFNGIDDANIYMVYMKHLATGQGFVYNTGGERVEGFTSMLWVLIGGVFFLITKHANFLLLALNVILIAYGLFKIAIFLHHNLPTSSTKKISLFFFFYLTAAVAGYYEWTLLSLMETALWSTALILLTLKTLEEKNKATPSAQYIFLLLILVLIRPESMLWGVLFIAIRIFFYKKSLPALADITWLVVKLFCPFILAVLLLTLFRVVYFGYPLPNTYYAKVSADYVANFHAGLNYVSQYFLHTVAASLALLFICVTCLLGYRKQPPANLTIPFIIFLFSLIPPVLTGGDHFAHFRFIQPTVPLLWMTLIVSFNEFSRIGAKQLVLKSAICLILLSTFIDVRRIYIKKYVALEGEFELANNGRNQSGSLNLFFNTLKTYPAQAVFAAGGAAYTYKGVTIDLLGLNNVEMAHANKIKNPGVKKNHGSFNKQVFFRQHPDIFFLGSGFTKDSTSQKMPAPFESAIFLNIQYDTAFQRAYRNVLLIKKQYPEYLQVFASNQFLQSLDPATYRIKFL